MPLLFVGLNLILKNFEFSFSSEPSVKQTIRYPGDIDEERPMSPTTTANSFRICKNKIKIQARENYRLKGKVERQKKQIQSLRALVKKLKRKMNLDSVSPNEPHNVLKELE